MAVTAAPVVDVYSARIRPEFGSIDGDQPGIGRLAAEFLISRCYRNFAYCGYDGIGYSETTACSPLRQIAERSFSSDKMLLHLKNLFCHIMRDSSIM